ncbi:MAG: DPP IV N-terminal domain-containing protein [Ginsengibacter sp.]
MYRILGPFLLIISFTISAQTKVLTADDYMRAENALYYKTTPLVDREMVIPNYFSGDLFWYRNLIAQGSEFILVNPLKGQRTQAFDQEKLARSLSSATGKSYSASMLPFQYFTYTKDATEINFYANGKLWKCDLKNYQCIPKPDNETVRSTPIDKEDGESVVSPDGKMAAFIRKDNLWVRNISTHKDVQLTSDGEKDFGYATDNAGWQHSDRAILRWSPDSKKIATFKQDQRKVNDMYLVTSNVGAPKLKSWKYELPGDSNIMMIHRVIIEVTNPKVIYLDVPADPHRATLSDDISVSGTFDDVEWSEDASQLAFVSTSRDHKIEKVRIADAKTGKVREIFSETVPTQFESGWGTINWKYLSNTNEIIWFSERDNWGHLYLYDALTGKLKNQITKGDWLVSQVLKIDERNRILYFETNGRQKENPYFSNICSINFDGKNLKDLTPEAGNHKVDFSPSEKYFIDNYSKPDVAATIVLRNLEGKIIVPLEKTNISRLLATGWKPVIPFSVKAADGKTDIYGLLSLPKNMEPNKKYPIIDYIYPGPQGGSVGDWSFSPSHGDDEALAALGFIVVRLEGTSNPLRSKSFHDMSYGNMAENTLPDQIAGIRQLSEKFPIDTNHVGIWGHSGGGFATAAAMFRYPDFFKVGISESGNHDNRNYEADWGERYNGLVENSDYDAQANQNYAKNLKGKLLLAHGLLDDNVPPSNTMLVVEALEKANKDFDLIVFPNSRHGYGQYAPYMMRRRWDYFVKNLLGDQPPYEYQLNPTEDPRNELK